VTSLLADTVVTHCPPDLDVRALRARWLHDPSLAYAAAPYDPRRPGIAGLGRELLASMGRPGVTWGRRHGEQHFLRPIPYWRTDGITDLLILDAQLLRIEGLSVLLDAAAATPLRTWLLLTEPSRPDVSRWLAEAHAPAIPWHEVEEYWERRIDPLTGLRSTCPTAAAPPWSGTEPIGIEEWTAHPVPCLLHNRPASCLREALRGAHARGELTPDEAGAVARDHFLALTRMGDEDAALAAAVLLGRDHFQPARTALVRLRVDNDVALEDVSRDGDVSSADRASDPLEAAALRGLRVQDTLAGCPATGPFLTIFGEAPGH
jgi:hypothetical protein